MPTTPFDTFSDGDLIEAHNVSEMHEPIQNLERGKSFYAEAQPAPTSSSVAYVAALDPPPDTTVPTGMFIHLKVPVTNAAGSPDVTLELNGATPVPILKRDGQSLEAGELLEGEFVSLIFDELSGSFRLLTSGGGSSGPIAWEDLPFDQATGNTILGDDSLGANTGDYNTAVGFSSLRDNTSGGVNTAVGYMALLSNTTADYNTAIGVYALSTNSTGAANTALGTNAMRYNEIGYENCAVGHSALAYLTSGIRNVAVGVQAAESSTTGELNTAVGWRALLNNVAGYSNTALGFGSGASITGNNNLVIGSNIDVPEAAESDQVNVANCLLRNGPRQNVSLRSGSAAYANSSDTVILDLTDLRGWIGFSDDQDGWCRLRVNPTGITIEASSADWVASSSPTSGQVGLYFSSGDLRMVLGSAAARTIGFTDNTTAF